MYPVAPACLIRFIKRMSVSFVNVIDLNVPVDTNGPVIAKIDDRGMDDYVIRQKLSNTLAASPMVCYKECKQSTVRFCNG